MIFEIIQVESYCGFRPNERPLSFEFHEKRWEVKEIIDRWYDGGAVSGRPTYDYFKVKTKGGKEFLLRHNERYNTWSILIG